MQTVTFTLPGSDRIVLGEILSESHDGSLLVRSISILQGDLFVLPREGESVHESEEGFWELLNEGFPGCDLDEDPKVNVRGILSEKEELVKKFFGDYSPREKDLDVLVQKIKTVVRDINICFPEIKELNYPICQGLLSLLNEIEDVDIIPEVEEVLEVRCEKWFVEKILYRDEIVNGKI